MAVLGASGLFEVVLHRQPGTKLGIDVDPGVNETLLMITDVKPGLVARWNAEHPEAAVEPGFYIVEVNGIRGSAAALKAECKVGNELRMFVQSDVAGQSCVADEPPATSHLHLPESVWIHIASYLHAHELLGRVAALCTCRAAMLGDERCWQTLSLPPGDERLNRMLDLMLRQEKELWAWPLTHVRVLDLDFSHCVWSTVDMLQNHLLRSLDIQDTLCRLTLRRVPTVPAAGNQDFALTPCAQDLVRLVNPVLANFPAAMRTIFLLLPGDLGQLRLRLAAFGRFCMRTSTDDAGKAASAVDLFAERGPLPLPDLEVLSGDQADAVEDAASTLLGLELGDLRRLPKESQVWVSQDFAGWNGRLKATYRKLVMDGAACRTAASDLRL